LTLDTGINNIAYIIAGGSSAHSLVSRLTFADIPEPGTLVLMVIGMLGIGLARHRWITA
jgi:hypothetical protein